MTAPDVYYAASVMYNSAFYHGKGDRKVVLEMITNNGEQYKAVGDKLALLVRGVFQGKQLFKDSYKEYLKEFAINKSQVQKLWVKLVKQCKILTNEQFVEIFPKAIKKVELWTECLDFDGKPTLNKTKFIAHFKMRMKQKKDQKAKRAKEVADGTTGVKKVKKTKKAKK